MILEKILFGIKYEIINNKNLDCEIKNLTIDSRQVVIGSMFFCIKGLNVDGHNFIDEAIKHGARAIMIENDLNNFDCDAVIIKVENFK